MRKLAIMSLADDVGAGRYQLAEGQEDTLRRMGERGDVFRTMQRELTRLRLERAGVDQVIADEHRDRRFLLIDGVGGRVHHIDVGRGEITEPLSTGVVVRIEHREAEVRAADRTDAGRQRASAGSGQKVSARSPASSGRRALIVGNVGG